MRPIIGPVVIGFHGCDRDFAMQALTGKASLKRGRKKYHWLGSGIYFWENDPVRAMEWAKEKKSRGELDEPYVIGALLELRNCLDVSVRENVPLVKKAYTSLRALYKSSGLGLPENTTAPKDKSKDKVLRALDHAVINHLIENSATKFDTVRGLFVEGRPIYSGGRLYEKSHIEIAVRSSECIRGLFIPN